MAEEGAREARLAAFRTLIERSSLGTEGAKRVRRRTTQGQVDAVRRRVEAAERDRVAAAETAEYLRALQVHPHGQIEIVSGAVITEALRAGMPVPLPSSQHVGDAADQGQEVASTPRPLQVPPHFQAMLDRVATQAVETKSTRRSEHVDSRPRWVKALLPVPVSSDQLQRFLGELSDADQVVGTLVMAEGLTIQETALLLGLELNDAESRLRRAVDLLAKAKDKAEERRRHIAHDQPTS